MIPSVCAHHCSCAQVLGLGGEWRGGDMRSPGGAQKVRLLADRLVVLAQNAGVPTSPDTLPPAELRFVHTDSTPPQTQTPTQQTATQETDLDNLVIMVVDRLALLHS